MSTILKGPVFKAFPASLTFFREKTRKLKVDSQFPNSVNTDVKLEVPFRRKKYSSGLACGCKALVWNTAAQQ